MMQCWLKKGSRSVKWPGGRVKKWPVLKTMLGRSAVSGPWAGIRDLASKGWKEIRTTERKNGEATRWYGREESRVECTNEMK